VFLLVANPALNTQERAWQIRNYAGSEKPLRTLIKENATLVPHTAKLLQKNKKKIRRVADGLT
jgi:hypothetical protein